MIADPLNAILTRGRSRLNRILIMDRVALWLSLVGGIAGATLLLACRMGWPGATWFLWAELTVMGGAWGFISGWRQRLDLEKTAQWLDDYLKDQQALAAALECMEHGSAGRFDAVVIRRACDIATENRVIHWPTHGLIRQASIALAIFISISLLFMIGLSGSPGRGYQTGAEQAELVGKNKSGTAGLRKGTMVQSPHTAAGILFPENPKLAAAAERAIREGNTALLEQLLKEAQLEMEKDLNLTKTDSVREQERLRNERQKRQMMLDSLLAQNSTGSNSATQSAQSGRNSRGDDEQTPGTNQTGSNPKAPDTGRNGSGEESNPASGRRYQPGQPLGSVPANILEQQSPDGSGPGGGLSGKGGPGRQPGTEMNWGKVTPRNGEQQLLISQSKPGAMLELVLPGKNVTVPLSEAIPDWRRAAEAALGREGVPGEYQDFVRSYFLELTQETTGDMPESGGQK